MIQFILIPIIAVLALLFACVLATKVTYGFSWAAILGLKREAKRNHVLYVSNGPFPPTAIYWLGSSDSQEDLVARAIAEGRLQRQRVDVEISKDIHWNAIVNKVQIWPTAEMREMFGSPRDLVAG